MHSHLCRQRARTFSNSNAVTRFADRLGLLASAQAIALVHARIGNLSQLIEGYAVSRMQRSAAQYDMTFWQCRANCYYTNPIGHIG